MVNFLRLTYRIINTKQISEIIINPKSYHIYFSYQLTGGFLFAGFGIISSDIHRIVIEKVKDKEDYETVTEWIKKID